MVGKREEARLKIIDAGFMPGKGLVMTKDLKKGDLLYITDEDALLWANFLFAKLLNGEKYEKN